MSSSANNYFTTLGNVKQTALNMIHNESKFMHVLPGIFYKSTQKAVVCVQTNAGARPHPRTCEAVFQTASDAVSD